MKMTVFFILLLFIVSISAAQESGEAHKKSLDDRFRETETDMREKYNDGNLNGVLDLYKKKCCLEDKIEKAVCKEKKEFKKVNKETRAQIYQWVMLSYSALDMPGTADIYLKKILILRRGEDPGKWDYWRPIMDAAKNKYYVAPRWLVGFKLGANFTIAHPLGRFNILQPAFETSEDFFKKHYLFSLNESRGTQLGFVVEFPLNRYLSLSFQPVFNTLRFHYENSFEWKDEGSEEAAAEANIAHRQRLNYIEIPLLFRYQLMRSKIKGYIQIGGFYQMMTSASKSMDISFRQTKTNFLVERTIKDKDIKDQINRSNFGLLAGYALGYDTGDLRLELEVNYKFAFKNIVNEDQRYENKELMLGFYDVFDDIKLSNWDISLKILLPVSFKAFRKKEEVP
jgi:hypothetical protein